MRDKAYVWIVKILENQLDLQIFKSKKLFTDFIEKPFANNFSQSKGPELDCKFLESWEIVNWDLIIQKLERRKDQFLDRFIMITHESLMLWCPSFDTYFELLCIQFWQNFIKNRGDFTLDWPFDNFESLNGNLLSFYIILSINLLQCSLETYNLTLVHVDIKDKLDWLFINLSKRQRLAYEKLFDLLIFARELRKIQDDPIW
jgi:hypothetical protein